MKKIDNADLRKKPRGGKSIKDAHPKGKFDFFDSIRRRGSTGLLHNMGPRAA